MKPRRNENLSLRITQDLRRWLESQARINKTNVTSFVESVLIEKRSAVLMETAGFVGGKKK